MLRASWAYSLKRDELVSYLKEFNLDVSGTVEELRKRWAKFLGLDHESEELERLLEIQSEHEILPGRLTPTILISQEDNKLEKSPVKNEQRTREMNDPTESRLNIMDHVRKWAVKYNGMQDPWEFIERVEELSRMYCVALNELPPLMSLFFSDRALIWFRNNNEEWLSWEAFKGAFCAFFLPPKYYEKLDEKIQRRKQMSGEPFKNYVLSLQNLMRHSSLNDKQRLERIYRNAHPDFLWYIRKKDFSTLAELIEQAEDLEDIKIQTTSNEAATSSRQRLICHSCGNDGHRTERCPNNVRNPGNRAEGRQN